MPRGPQAPGGRQIRPAPSLGVQLAWRRGNGIRSQRGACRQLEPELFFPRAAKGPAEQRARLDPPSSQSVNRAT